MELEIKQKVTKLVEDALESIRSPKVVEFVRQDRPVPSTGVNVELDAIIAGVGSAYTVTRGSGPFAPIHCKWWNNFSVDRCSRYGAWFADIDNFGHVSVHNGCDNARMKVSGSPRCLAVISGSDHGCSVIVTLSDGGFKLLQVAYVEDSLTFIRSEAIDAEYIAQEIRCSVRYDYGRVLKCDDSHFQWGSIKTDSSFKFRVEWDGPPIEATRSTGAILDRDSFAIVASDHVTVYQGAKSYTVDLPVGYGWDGAALSKGVLLVRGKDSYKSAFIAVIQ
jgi:hypothetical protein